MLGCADEVEVFALNFVHHRIHIGLAHNALDDVAVYHKGRDAVDEALIYHKIASVGQNRGVQAGDIAHKVVEAVAGNAAGRVHIYAVEALHYLGVVGNIKIGDYRFAEALYLDVIAVVRADGNAGVDDIRDIQHNLVDTRSVLLLQRFKLSETVGICLDLSLYFLSLFELGGVFLGLTHEHTDLLREGISACAQITCFGYCGTVLRVKLQNLIDKGQLRILKFLFDVLTNYIGIISYKLYVQHFSSPVFIV